MLQEYFRKILDEYVKSTEFARTTNEIPSLKTTLNGVNGDLPNEIVKQAKLPISYQVKGSVGIGNITPTPWLAIFDREITTSAQKGFYVVYLFKKDMSGVYLSLNQGWTQYKEAFPPASKARRKIKEISNVARNRLRSVNGFSFNEIDLKAKGSTKARGYEEGNICSLYYPSKKLPSDDVIVSDLWTLLGVYRELKGYIGIDILNIEAKTLGNDDEQEYQENAQKQPDKKLSEGPLDKKSKITRPEKEVFDRDPSIASLALKNANYLCKVDSNHSTFIKETNGHQFMEAHHLVPMSKQDDFMFSLDVPENIISLCPLCHRTVHSAVEDVKKPILEKLYQDRKEGLESRGINLTLRELKEFY